MDYEKKYKRKALEPIVNYIESVMDSYSKEELEARIKKALPEKESKDERIRKAISTAICLATPEIVLEAKGVKLVDALAYLEKQKEQKYTNSEKPKEWSEDERIMEHCIWMLKGCLAMEDGLFDKEKVKADIAWLEKQKEQKDWAEELNTKIKELHKQCLAQLKPAEWSEEDEAIACKLEYILRVNYVSPYIIKWALEHLRPQPKQEGEPMEIKFAGKIYKVYGTKELPGEGVGYIIEDEPGHYDCIIHPEEVLGGGYGIKSHGSPYPTKGTNFSQPHWKPSEE